MLELNVIIFYTIKLKILKTWILSKIFQNNASWTFKILARILCFSLKYLRLFWSCMILGKILVRIFFKLWSYMILNDLASYILSFIFLFDQLRFKPIPFILRINISLSYLSFPRFFTRDIRLLSNITNWIAILSNITNWIK